MSPLIILLPGDGIGPEVTAAADRVLKAVTSSAGITCRTEEHLIGGAALDAVGDPLPEDTLQACRKADAALLGAVGGPKWDDPRAEFRPEQGLLGLRKELDLFANLRPVEPHPQLLESSPIKSELLRGVKLLVVRELTGGIYFGCPSKRWVENNQTRAVDTMHYSASEVRRIAHLAFQLAENREGKVTSVDKANVLESSRLWREEVRRTAASYPDIELENLLVDAAAMHLLTRPASFDVLVTSNMFGDILTDEASVLTGSLGNMPSASLGEHSNSAGHPRGVYEPIHGSAPDIAQQGIANPLGAILSTAMMLRHSLGMEESAQAVEQAVTFALEAGSRTADLAGGGETPLSTEEMTEAVLSYL